MRYSQDLIEQIRDANNIVDIIGQYTELKGRGHQFMGLCPFPDHNEKSPSFSVSENKQLYHCFGCKKSGNLFTFLETHSGMSFMEALEFLARRANIALPETEEESKDKTSRSLYYRLNKFAAAFYHRQLKALPLTHPVRQYLAQRDITDEVIETFKLGYASEEWSGLYEFFREKHAPLKDAEALGLIKPKQKQNGYFDVFRHRVMYPIFSQQEEVVGFGGRVVNPEDQPKYRNSSESPVFSKGRLFYGFNLSAKHIRQKDRAVIVEGYMDLIALYQAGITNVVATLGTALTEDHARLIQKSTAQVVLMFDGDFAGQQAAERSLIPMLSQGLCPLVVFLPESLDPDEYVKKYGVEDLQLKVDQAPELFICIINDWLKDFKFTSGEKLQFMDKVAPLLLSISDRGLQDLYVQEVAKRLTVDEKWVVQRLREEKPRPQFQAPSAPVPTPMVAPLEKVSLKKAPKEEVYILGISLNSPELLDKVIGSQVIEQMVHGGVKQLLAAVIERYGQNPNDFDKLAPLIVSQVVDPVELTGLFKFWSLTGAENEAEKATMNCIKRVQERHLRRQSEIIAGQLQNGVDGAIQEKLEQIMNIQKNRIQLNRPVKGEP